MPTYQYACTACEHRFEAVQAFSDASLTQCPVCSGSLRKVFNSVGIVFKGSGFYRTDSREKAGSGSGEKAGSGSTEKAGSGPAATSTSAPAAASSSGSSSAGSAA